MPEKAESEAAHFAGRGFRGLKRRLSMQAVGSGSIPGFVFAFPQKTAEPARGRGTQSKADREALPVRGSVRKHPPPGMMGRTAFQSR